MPKGPVRRHRDDHDAQPDQLRVAQDDRPVDPAPDVGQLRADVLEEVGLAVHGWFV